MAKIADAALRHSFRLLVLADQGREPGWVERADPISVQCRVETLAVLLNLIPRSRLDQLGSVVTAWNKQFPEADGISVERLRAVAHETLRGTSRRADVNDRQLDRLRALVDDTGSVRVGRWWRGATNTEAAKAECLAALEYWHSLLRSSPEWTTLPGVIPGTPAIPLEEVYVDLHATPCVDHASAEQPLRTVGYRRGGGTGGSEQPLVNAAGMVSRTLETCIVMGEPGSGKSTLVQWIAWSIARGAFQDFDVGLVVRLRQFASALRENPELTIVDSFLISLGRSIRDRKRVAEHIRNISRMTRRVLLLLDGWDEVPSSQRTAVQRRISEELPDFVVVVTSRTSGLPRQLIRDDVGDFYEIAGLSLATIQTFVGKQLRARGRPEELDRVVARIAKDRDLREMAANPFLLGMLVGVLSSPDSGGQRITRADLYQQIVDWMVTAQQQQQAEISDSGLSGRHLQALERLSYLLIFSEDSARYLFRKRELDTVLGRTDVTPLIQSRFIHRIDSVYDGWSLLHATLTEFLAAMHLEVLPDLDMQFAWDSVFYSPRRFAVLEFLAGLSGPAARNLRARASGWLENPDRFGLVLQRLARLAVSGQWLYGNREFVNRLIERMWLQICRREDVGFLTRFVHALAEISPDELLSRAAQLKGNSGIVWEAVCDAVRADVVRESELFGVLPKRLKEFVEANTHEGVTQEELEQVLERLSVESTDPDELKAAFDAAGLVRKPSVALKVLDRIYDLADGPVREHGLLSLAQIVTALPGEVLVRLVTTADEIPAMLRRMASDSLSHGIRQGAALDPVGRDAILKTLAALPVDDSRIEPMLAALVGFPVRDGGRIIALLGEAFGIDPSVREMAIRVLHTVADRPVVESVVATAESEQSVLVLPALLQLAMERKIGLQRSWLEARIAVETNPLMRRTLLAISIELFESVIPQELPQWDRFLMPIFRQCLMGRAEDTHAFELTATLKRGSARCGTYVSERLHAELATATDRLLNQPKADFTGTWQLVVTLWERSPDPQAGHHLKRILDVLLATLSAWRGDQLERRKCEAAAMGAAEALAARDVGRMLEYPPNCEPVRMVLANLAIGSGWMVFDDRIWDADGNEIANIHRPQVRGETPSAETVQALLENLTEAPRNALISFWLLTSNRELCGLNSTYENVYAALETAIDGDEYPELSRQLKNQYSEGLPDQGAWIRSLGRAIEVLQSIPAGVDFLNSLGLPRHRSVKRRAGG